VVPPAFTPSPKFKGEVRILPKFRNRIWGRTGGGLGLRYNGRSRPSYNMSRFPLPGLRKRNLLLRGQW
jgi:hypothetical protein